MKVFKHINIFFIIAIVLSQQFCDVSYAEEGDGGTESNLGLGYGARALGLGNAFTALADDPTAVFWNPAGLEYIYQQSATLFHTSLWEGISYDFLGYAYPTLASGTFGFGLGRIAVGDVAQMDASGTPVNGGNTFSNEEIQVYLSYAKKLPFNITSGITIRFVRRGWNGLEGFGDLVDTGFGGDVGAMYRPDWFGSPWLQDWSFGLKIHNFFAPQLKEGTQIDALPLTMRLGFMKKIRFVGGEFFNVMFDFDYSEKRSTKLHLGSEYRFRNYGDVRMGFGAGGLTFGFGLEYNMFQFDYAFGYNGSSEFFGSVHRLSLSVNFGLNRDELYQIAESKRIAEEERLIAEMLEANKQRFIAEHTKVANDYYDSERYLDAIVEYQQVLSRDSLNTYAMAMLDSSNNKLQQNFNAIQAQAVQDALDKNRAEDNRTFIEQHFGRGMQYLDQNRFRDALLEFNLALERDTVNQPVIEAIRTTQRRISEEAIRLIQQSRQELSNQNYSDALLLLADARTLSEDNPTRMNEINNLTNEVNIQKNIQRGILLYQIGEFAQALTVFETLLTADAENEIAKDYYEKCKLETISKTEEMDEETQKRYLEGMNFYLNGEYAKAIPIWEAILVEQPYNKTVLSALQRLRERVKQNSR